jgi:hypothetical protein
MVSESSGRNESKFTNGLETGAPEAEPSFLRRRQHGPSQTGLSGETVSRGYSGSTMTRMQKHSECDKTLSQLVGSYSATRWPSNGIGADEVARGVTCANVRPPRLETEYSSVSRVASGELEIPLLPNDFPEGTSPS